jgi:hypothetical protein
MVTTDLESLSSISNNEIVVVERQSDEFGDDRDARLEARGNASLGRDDLRVIRLLRGEEIELPQGLSFQEFRKKYRPPQLICACPKCGHGEAMEVRSISPSAYQGGGGILTVPPTLELRD